MRGVLYVCATATDLNQREVVLPQASDLNLCVIFDWNEARRYKDFQSFYKVLNPAFLAFNISSRKPHSEQASLWSTATKFKDLN